MSVAFDADVLVYAASPGHRKGDRVWAHLDDPANQGSLFGSTVLLAQLLARPVRGGRRREVDGLLACLARLYLVPPDEATSMLAAQLGARHRLRPLDALHLATAIGVGAERFCTANPKAFRRSVDEIEVVGPSRL